MAEEEGLLQPVLSEISCSYLSEKDSLPTSSRPHGIREFLAPTKVWFPWLVAGVFALLWLRLYTQQGGAKLGTYEMGFTSDLYPARSHIELERKLFRGTAIPDDPAASRDAIVLDLLGPASDAAWDHILKGQYMLITEDEAKRTWGDDIERYWDYNVGGYRASVSFTHTLHCLVGIFSDPAPVTVLMRSQNWLRVMNSSQLQLIEAGEDPQPHHAHCLGQIRQYIL